MKTWRQRQDLYDTLTTELNTRDSVKESVDILAHLTAENGRLLMELIRLQAAATQADATNQLAQSDAGGGRPGGWQCV